MSRIKTCLIGRHSCCDFRVVGRSVSRRHAEIVPLANGRFYLTDLNSTFGTFVLKDGTWQRVRQSFIEPDQNVRLGRREINAAEFGVLYTSKNSWPNKDHTSEPQPPRKSIPKNYGVRRNPETGEVVIQPSDK